MDIARSIVKEVNKHFKDRYGLAEFFSVTSSPHDSYCYGYTTFHSFFSFQLDSNTQGSCTSVSLICYGENLIKIKDENLKTLYLFFDFCKDISFTFSVLDRWIIATYFNIRISYIDPLSDNIKQLFYSHLILELSKHDPSELCAFTTNGAYQNFWLHIFQTNYHELLDSLNSLELCPQMDIIASCTFSEITVKQYRAILALYEMKN